MVGILYILLVDCWCPRYLHGYCLCRGFLPVDFFVFWIFDRLLSSVVPTYLGGWLLVFWVFGWGDNGSLKAGALKNPHVGRCSGFCICMIGWWFVSWISGCLMVGILYILLVDSWCPRYLVDWWLVSYISCWLIAGVLDIWLIDGWYPIYLVGWLLVS